MRILKDIRDEIRHACNELRDEIAVSRRSASIDPSRDAGRRAVRCCGSVCWYFRRAAVFARAWVAGRAGALAREMPAQPANCDPSRRPLRPVAAPAPVAVVATRSLRGPPRRSRRKRRPSPRRKRAPVRHKSSAGRSFELDETLAKLDLPPDRYRRSQVPYGHADGRALAGRGGRIISRAAAPEDPRGGGRRSSTPASSASEPINARPVHRSPPGRARDRAAPPRGYPRPLDFERDAIR